MVNSETWKGLIGWPYELSTLGHIRRKNSKKLLKPFFDKQGFAAVILTKSRYEQAFYLDVLVASAFHGTGRIMSGRPLHADGSPWNNWPNNLLWGLRMELDSGDNLITNWTLWAGGKLQHGPYTDRELAMAMARPGDAIIGRNPKRKIVALEIMFSRNRAMSPRNPYDLANEYRAAAKMHNDSFWAIMLSEAAEVIEALATQTLVKITNGNLGEVETQAQYRQRLGLNGGPKLVRRVLTKPVQDDYLAGISDSIPRRMLRRPLSHR